MNLDFKHLEKSIGKTLKFEVGYPTENGLFIDVFYAALRKINEDSIIVEELFVLVEEDYKETLRVQKRLLIKGQFRINREIPLNG